MEGRMDVDSKEPTKMLEMSWILGLITVITHVYTYKAKDAYFSVSRFFKIFF